MAQYVRQAVTVALCILASAGALLAGDSDDSTYAAAITISPNPMVPLVSGARTGEPSLRFSAAAADLVERNGAGTRIAVSVPAPEQGSQHVDVSVSVLDVVGNPVAFFREPKLLLVYLCREPTEPVSLNFYWDGLNAQGTPAAPGLYRVVVKVVGDADGAPPLRFTANIGVKR